jgi:Cu-processing system ATP-binding protein
VIEIRNLQKRFGKFVALHDVSLSLSRGHTVGIIGPNGSGKSTLIKCLLGLVTPTAGQITIDGYLLNGSSEYRQKIGYVSQIARFPQDLTGQEIIDIIKGLRKEGASLENDLIERFGIQRELGKRIRTLSGGTRQKLSMVLGCMYDPELLILDEPSAGLDPVSNLRLREFLQIRARRQRTTLITTHIMSDLEELAQTVIVLLDGRVRFAGPIRNLKLDTGEIRLENAVARLLERGAA